jgi:hypothetical protein
MIPQFKCSKKYENQKSPPFAKTAKDGAPTPIRVSHICFVFMVVENFGFSGNYFGY